MMLIVNVALYHSVRFSLFLLYWKSPYDFLLFFSTSVAEGCKVAEELKRADVVVFTYACDEPATLHRLSTFGFQNSLNWRSVPFIIIQFSFSFSKDMLLWKP